jgi:tRNA threonylcarbamoyl adenosine modification protein (Sua5/YciO/YrdC/YwlC family)
LNIYFTTQSRNFGFLNAYIVLNSHDCIISSGFKKIGRAVAAKMLKIYLDNPHQRYINMAADILKNDGLISYPTDTVYGLGASINSKSAVDRIFKIKQVSNTKLLSFICKDIQEISQYAQISNRNYRIMKRCLPGPFTFILPTTNKTPKLIYQKRRTVGIRIPDSALCHALVSTLGNPVISTSVPAGPHEILNDPQEIERRMGDQLDIIFDGGILISEPSTIVDLTEYDPEIIR